MILSLFDKLERILKGSKAFAASAYRSEERRCGAKTCELELVASGASVPSARL